MVYKKKKNVDDEKKVKQKKSYYYINHPSHQCNLQAEVDALHFEEPSTW